MTGRRRIERELRESEERFRATFERAPIGISICDLDGRYLQVNQALCDITGYSEEELLATSFQTITHPDDAEADAESVMLLLVGRAWCVP